MSIIEKVFKYEVTELPVIKYEDEIWFKAVVVATILTLSGPGFEKLAQTGGGRIPPPS